MSLSPFLRGKRPRPNPTSTFSLERRHAEGGAWIEVDADDGRARLDEEMRGPAFALEPGDLVRLRQSVAVRGWAWTLATWVQTLGGLVALARPSGLTVDPADDDWASFWEDPDTHAITMLGLCTDVDAPRLVLLACALARRVLSILPARQRRWDDRPDVALAAAEAWARGARGPQAEALFAEAQRAVPAVEEAQREYARAGAVEASLACRATIEALGLFTRERLGIRCAQEALHNAVRAETVDGPPETQERDYDRAQRGMAPLVRQHVPLSILLRARAGDVVPLDG